MIMPCDAIQNRLSELFVCMQVKDRVRVRTPFLFPDGDVIDLYFKDTPDGGELTDLGETTRWLRMQTASSRRTAKQSQLIQDICLNHGIEFYRGMLLVRLTSDRSIAEEIVRLGQAAVRVSDLWFTFRTQSFESIREEVAELLTSQEIDFKQGDRLLGRSGRSWTIDFHTRTQTQSSLICLLSTGSRSVSRRVAEHVLAAWVDLNHLLVGREPLQFVSLFDDTLDVWTEEDFRLVEQHSTITRWSAPEDFIRVVTSAA